MTQSSALAIILAAGKGTRMKSDLPKVLHNVAGAPMLAHVLAASRDAAIEQTALVIGPSMEKVADDARKLDPGVTVFVQAKQQGTADAVKAARPVLEEFQGHVLILYGDTPLIRAETLTKARNALDDGADLVVIGFEAERPDRLWTAAPQQEGQAGRDSRGEGRERRRARAHALQFRHHGFSLRPNAARAFEPYRQ